MAKTETSRLTEFFSSAQGIRRNRGNHDGTHSSSGPASLTGFVCVERAGREVQTWQRILAEENRLQVKRQRGLTLRLASNLNCFTNQCEVLVICGREHRIRMTVHGDPRPNVRSRWRSPSDSPPHLMYFMCPLLRFGVLLSLTDEPLHVHWRVRHLD